MYPGYCYVVSYTTSSQHYAYTEKYFLTRGSVRAPLSTGVPRVDAYTMPQPQNLGGVFTYALSPTPSWQFVGDGTYWVDPVFASRLP